MKNKFYELGFNSFLNPVKSFIGFLGNKLHSSHELKDYINLNTNKLPIYKKGIYSEINKKNNYTWLKNYLENSDNLIEKKYKLICLKIFFNDKKDIVDNFIDNYKDIIENVSKELKEKNLINYEIIDLFLLGKNLFSYQNKSFSYNFIKPLESQDELEIAQKVYLDFQNGGMLGRTMQKFGSEIFQILVKLQNYRLSEEDKKSIHNVINMLNNPQGMFNSIDKTYYIHDITSNSELMNDFLSINDNTNDLLTIKEFFICINDQSNEQINNHIEYINKKVDSLILKKEIEDICMLKPQLKKAKHKI
jgi:hypothetical protein